MEESQWQAPDNKNVRQRGGSEAEAMAGGRGVAEHDGGISGLQETFGISFIV